MDQSLFVAVCTNQQLNYFLSSSGHVAFEGLNADRALALLGSDPQSSGTYTQLNIQGYMCLVNRPYADQT